MGDNVIVIDVSVLAAGLRWTVTQDLGSQVGETSSSLTGSFHLQEPRCSQKRRCHWRKRPKTLVVLGGSDSVREGCCGR